MSVGTAMTIMVELFRNKGYAAVSLDDLSDATGLSRPSLYRAFGFRNTGNSGVSRSQQGDD